MTDTTPTKSALIFFVGAQKELNQLSAVMEDIGAELGLTPPGYLVHYVDTRRDQLSAILDRLRAELVEGAG